MPAEVDLHSDHGVYTWAAVAGPVHREADAAAEVVESMCFVKGIGSVGGRRDVWGEGVGESCSNVSWQRMRDCRSGEGVGDDESK